MLSCRVVGGACATRRAERWRGVAFAGRGCRRGGRQVGMGRRRCGRRLCPSCASDTYHPLFIPSPPSHPIHPPSPPCPAPSETLRVDHHAVPDISPVHSPLHVCHACRHIAFPATTYSRAGNQQEG
ncbi:hypothetical protein AYX15_01845 [Cryptococcus neoformans]|nr:hypothetical protein AYX15_01845 [Cryptococcus neoformans var. grubii]